MNDQNYSATIKVKQSPSEAFSAIKNFKAWWSEEIEGETDQLNEVFFYHYKDVHLCKIKLIEIVPDKKLVYHVLDNQFSFIKDKTEWINSKLIFDITTEGNETIITFTHEGLNATHECYNVCYDAWGNYIHKSLYNLITVGKGNPNPSEGEGYNAELVEKWKIKSTETEKIDFKFSFEVDQSAKEVFDAILNVRGWWSGLYGEEIEGTANKLNDEFTFRAGGGMHYSKQKLIELIPEKKVVWLVTESNLSFLEKPNEWTNTKICFEIHELKGKTKVIFTHRGLFPDIECYNECSNAWSQYMHQFMLKLKRQFKAQGQEV